MATPIGRAPWLTLAMALATTLVLAIAAPTSAQLPVTPQLSVFGGLTGSKVVQLIEGDESGSEKSTGATVGADLSLRVMGVVAGVRYQRIFNSATIAVNSTNLEWGLDANEFGGFLELHRSLAPTSPLQPSLGVGASLSKISLDDSLGFGSSLPAVGLGGDARSLRIYGLFSVSLLGKLGIIVRGGNAWATVDASDLELDQVFSSPGGDLITFDQSYDGFFLNVGLSLGLL